GEPVLTVEPYGHLQDPDGLMRRVRGYLQAHGLPLTADGPHPGVWNDGTVLVMLRHDGEATPLAADCDMTEMSEREVSTA
ncbi:MAG: hypothetical protein ACRDP6_08415, partial [Actinoallomurus sp.]